MVTLPALFTDVTTVVALFRLYTMLNTTCQTACDVDLESCAALCAVGARPQGYDVREARAAYSLASENCCFEQVLKERELLKVVRSSRDRRALAFQATPKGRDRIVLAYRVLGACLVQKHPGMTEQNFDQLVKLCYDYATSVGFPVCFDGLFPAPVLRDLAAYAYRVELVAARFGMTSAQVALLLDRCAVAGTSATRGANDAQADTHMLELASWVFEAELGLLRDRGFLADVGAQGCTEAAEQRIAEFSQRLAIALTPWWQARTSRSQAAAVKLLQYTLYLFS